MKVTNAQLKELIEQDAKNHPAWIGLQRVEVKKYERDANLTVVERYYDNSERHIYERIYTDDIPALEEFLDSETRDDAYARLYSKMF